MTLPIVLTAAKAKARLHRLIEHTAESHRPIMIVGKRNSAVLVSADDWQAIWQAIHSAPATGTGVSPREEVDEPHQG